MAEDLGLPPLTGSPKQIDWAEKIRRKILTECAEILRLGMHEVFHRSLPAEADDYLDEHGIESQVFRAAMVQVYDNALARFRALKGETSAAWWIDHRHDRPKQLMGIPTLAALTQELKSR